MIEGTNVFVTPRGDTLDKAPGLAEHEMVVIERPNGSIEVHDPLFEAPYAFGDGSTLSDPIADRYILAHWQHHHGLHGSTRQLSNTERHETKRGTGRWTRGQHMLSAAAITLHFGGSPLQVMQMASHDTGHRRSSHRVDDLLAGRGSENHHDLSQAEFMRRNGFIERLAEAGVIDQDDYVAGTNTHISEVVHLQNLPEGLINWPGKSGNLEAERLQYLLHELGIWVYGMNTSRAILDHIYRDPDSPQGDQLIFDDPEAAALLTKGQIRCFSEHWSETGNDLVDELLIAVDKYLLTSRDEAFTEYNQYYPGDTLYTLEEDWLAAVDNAHTGQAKAFVSGFSKIINALCTHQQEVHDNYDNSHNLYKGPALPDWITIQQSLYRSSDHRQRTMYQRVKGMQTEYLVLEMQQGKVRAIDPWVKLPGKDLQRVSALVPSVATFREMQTRWCQENYDAIINLAHPSLMLSPVERKAMREGLAASESSWPEALARPEMPDEVLKKRLAHSTERYRQIGSLAAVGSFELRAS